MNATFYRLPRESAVAAWVAATPPGFVFAVRMSRYVTHIRRLRGLPDSLALLYATGARADGGLDVHPLPPRAPRRGGNYSESELRDWAERIDGWRQGAEVFASFNNDWQGYAPRNARLLRRLLGVTPA